MKCLELYRKKPQPLATRLPSYSPLSILFRFTIVSVIAIGILHVISLVVEPLDNYPEEKIPYVFYLVTILSFNCLSELQIILDNILERFFPIPEKIKLRILIQIAVGLLFLVITHRIVSSYLVAKVDIPHSKPAIMMGVLTGLVFIQMMASSLAIARFTQKWIDAQEEIAEMKREKLNMDYNSLQDQLNPHFLFNNLSVLKSLIIYDQDTAVDFTENFTDVYRYVLQSKNKRLVKFSEELDFMKANYGLHKERLGDGLEAEVNIPEEYLEKEIAPLTAQLLIENAVKHNIVSRETPLKIEVYIEDDNLVVANNLNLRQASYSTKTGLKNLVKRYEMLTDRELIVQHNDERFEVKVPLL
jgi:sensor histidine kinase YesM